MDGSGKERREEANQRSAQAVGRRDERKRRRSMERRRGERRERTGTGEHSPPRERRTGRSNLEAGDRNRVQRDWTGERRRNRSDSEERDGLERRGGQAEEEQQEEQRRERPGDREDGRRTPTSKALGVKILYTNAQSLISKIDELNALASEMKPDFIMLTETWCNSTIDNALLTMPGYGLEIRKDRMDTAQGIGGGLIVYAKEGWKLEEEEEVNNFNQHSKFKVKCGAVEITFVLIYRSPNAATEEGERILDGNGRETDAAIGGLSHTHKRKHAGPSHNQLTRTSDGPRGRRKTREE